MKVINDNGYYHYYYYYYYYYYQRALPYASLCPAIQPNKCSPAPDLVP